MEETNDGCKGCRMHNKYISGCEVDIVPCILDGTQCPCMTCLIKVMCNNACEKFQEYSKLILPENIRLYKNRRSDRITDDHFIRVIGV